MVSDHHYCLHWFACLQFECFMVPHQFDVAVEVCRERFFDAIAAHSAARSNLSVLQRA
jgi:hypothetical protein